MEILFLYIEDYKGILKKQSFNFSSEFYFEYKNQKILYIKNDNYIPNFFNHGNRQLINNITAIVGENGSGKTSLIDFIKYNLCEDCNNVKYDFIIIFRENKSTTIRIKSSNKIKIRNEGSLKKKFEMYRYNELDPQGIIEEFKNVTIIFYSNIFDAKNEFLLSKQSNQLMNISTNYLLYKDYGDYGDKLFIFKNKSESNLEIVDGLNPITIHRKFDIKRQIFFVKDNDNSIPLPSTLLLSFTELTYSVLFKKQLSETDIKASTNRFGYSISTVLQEMDSRFNKYMNRFKNDDRRKYMEGLVAKNIFYNFYLGRESKGFNFDYDKLDELLFDINEEPLIDLCNKFTHLISNIGHNDSLIIDYRKNVKEYLQVLIDLSKFLVSFIERYSLFIQFNESVIKFEGVRNNSDELFLLINKYLRSTPSIDYIDYEWSELSSGEKAKLNLFSRFYELLHKKVNRYHRINENILILIDEGELYYHPQWQKCFINDMIDFFNTMFDQNENINIQIILTSNSPFIISDLPKSNVIFLQKNNESIKTVNLDEKRQTFASNIHSLLMDSFFIRNGLVGDFAKKKIDKVIETLRDKNIDKLDDDSIQEIKNTINIIGEPVIRNKLINMLEENLKTNLINSHNRIKDLEARVRRLEKGHD